MSKEVFAIKAEEDTPAVSMEKGATGSFVSIRGLSMPENPLE